MKYFITFKNIYIYILIIILNINTFLLVPLYFKLFYFKSCVIKSYLTDLLSFEVKINKAVFRWQLVKLFFIKINIQQMATL